MVLLSELQGCQEGKRNLLCDKLLSNVKKFEEFLQSSTTSSELFGDMLTRICCKASHVRWNYVECLLALLNLLSNELQKLNSTELKPMTSMSRCATALDSSSSPLVSSQMAEAVLDTVGPPICAATLSLSQKKTVAAAFEFIITFGICPCLQPGVGVTASHRSELVSLINEAIIPSPEDNLHLTLCVNSLIAYLKLPEFSEILVSRFAGDILVALLQLGYDADLLTKRSAISYGSDKLEQAIDPICEQSCGCFGERRNLPVFSLESPLEKFIERIPPSKLVQELLILQAGVPKMSSKMASTEIAKAPIWLRKACRFLIQKTVSKCDGVFDVLNGLLQDVVEDEFRKCDVAAHIVHDCYRYVCSYQQHFAILASQVLKLISELNSGPLLRASVIVVSLMVTCDPELTQEHVIKPLLHQLYMCLNEISVSEQTQLSNNSPFISESALTKSIKMTHTVFVLYTEPMSPLITIGLMPILDVLFELYKHTQQSVTYLRDTVSEIIERVLTSQDVATTVQCLNHLSFGNSAMSKQLRFVNGENGGILVLFNHEEINGEDGEWVTSADTVVELISTLQHKQENVVAEFFLSCLEELTCLISEMDDELAAPSDGELSLLELDNRIVKAEKRLKHNLLLLGMIGALCERLEQQCLQNTTHIIKFVRVTLERGKKVSNSTGFEFCSFESETLLLAMGLLSTLMTDDELCKKIKWDETDSLLPLLQYFSESHSDESIKQIAFSLRVAVATHGTVQTDCVSANNIEDTATTNSGKMASSTVNTSQLIEVIDDKTNSTLAELKNTVPEANGTLCEALKMMKDPLVPVQGHALILLRRMVEHKDKDALESSELLFKLSVDNIAHNDSYIYLNAVQLLSALVIKCPKNLLPRLIKDYSGGSPCDTHLPAESRMKLGEVLVKTSAALGPLVPHYRDILIGSCLNAARDSDPLIRASALSNLGQVCQHLHFSLGSVMFEVFECIQALIKLDSSAEVRRSAAVCATLLLRGLSKDAIKVLGGDLMKNFYRMLKHVHTVEKDDVVKLHVQLAFEEIDSFMKDYLFPKQNFTKKIHVLDPLDVD